MGALHEWAFAPSGSRMALGWDGELRKGIFVIDPADATVTKLAPAVPDALFWPSDDMLVFSIVDGGDRGTWLLGLDGQPARRLFGYPAERVAGLPDGRLLLVANNTLWQSSGAGEPQMLGREGTITFSDRFTWLQSVAR